MLPPVSCFQDQEHPPCHPNLQLPFKEDVTLSSKQINIDYTAKIKNLETKYGPKNQMTPCANLIPSSLTSTL